MEKSIKRVQKICGALTVVMKICSFIMATAFILSVPCMILGHTFQVSAEQLNAILFNSCSVCIQSFFLLIVFILAHKIFKDISREYTPFLPHNVKRIKTISLVMIVEGIVSPAAIFALRKLFSIEAYCAVNGTGYIFLGILFYCFAVIFEYACLLQKQSDETM